MKVVEALERSLRQGGASFMCLKETGEVLRTDPGRLLEHCSQILQPKLPLDVFHPDSSAAVMSAFLRALTDGMSSAIVKTPDGLATKLDLFDTRPSTHQIVAVLTPTDAAPDLVSPTVALPTRLITGRINVSGRTVEISESVTQLLGWSRDEYMNLTTPEKLHPDDVRRVVESFVDVASRPGGTTRIRQRFRHKDGTWRWFEITQTNLLHTDDPHILAESLDISAEMEAQVALQEREALLGRLNDALPVGILHTQHDGTVTLANAVWRELSRCEAGNELGGLLQAINETGAVQLAVEQCRTNGTDADLSVTFPEMGNPSCRHAELRIRPLRDDVAPYGLLFTLTDVTQSVANQANLWNLARHDHLTQVRNRLGIEEAVSKVLLERSHDSPPVTAVYLDLNGFKLINDQLGHAIGDDVLVATAEEVQRQLRPQDLVGRLGGDEFLILLRDSTPAETQGIVRRIQRQLRAIAPTASEGIELSAAIGIANARVGDTFDDLVNRGDKAMYRKKTARYR